MAAASDWRGPTLPRGRQLQGRLGAEWRADLRHLARGPGRVGVAGQAATLARRSSSADERLALVAARARGYGWVGGRRTSGSRTTGGAVVAGWGGVLRPWWQFSSAPREEAPRGTGGAARGSATRCATFPRVPSPPRFGTRAGQCAGWFWGVCGGRAGVARAQGGGVGAADPHIAANSAQFLLLLLLHRSEAVNA